MAESFKMCYFFLYHLSAALCCKYAALFLVPLFLALAMYLCHFSNLQTPEYILPTPIKIVYEIPNACVCIDSYTFSNLTQVPICAFSFIFFIFLLKDNYSTELCCFLSNQTWISHRYTYQFSSVQSLSHVQLFVTPWTAARQAPLSINNSWSQPKPISIEPVMPSNHLILCHPLFPPSIFPSIGVFSNESVLCIRWPKYWSFSFSISPSSEHSGLISFRMDWLDLLAVQGTLKSLLQHHSSRASNLRHSAFSKV